MLSIKNGTLGCRIHPEDAMSLAVMILNQLFEEYKIDAELSSGREGEHIPGSKHWTGKAYDITVRSYAAQITLNDILTRGKNRLGDDFDLILTGKTFHVEFDPKTSLGTIGE